MCKFMACEIELPFTGPRPWMDREKVWDSVGDQSSQHKGKGLCWVIRGANAPGAQPEGISEPALVNLVSREGNPRLVCVEASPSPGCSEVGEVSGIVIPAGTSLALYITQRHKHRLARSKNPCPKSPERQENRAGEGKTLK